MMRLTGSSRPQPIQYPKVRLVENTCPNTRCRRPQLCLRQRRSTIRRRLQEWMSCCSATSSTDLERMGFAQECPTAGCEDNTACIEWGNNVIGGRERAKHIDIRKHFAHEVIQNGKMLLVRVPTASQLADVFTKALPTTRSGTGLRGGRHPRQIDHRFSLSREGGSASLSSRVTSALKRGVST